MTGRAFVLRADARALPLPDASVDLVVTSPPYYALRAYEDGGEVYERQIGAEPTAAGYVDSLVECTREWLRVLKPAGSLWVNLGDKYATDGRGPDGTSSGLTNGAQIRPGLARASAAGVPRKSLIGLPARYVLRCVDELRLVWRQEIIWSKPNGLPESVTDRVRRSHEHWFHLTPAAVYYAAVDRIRQEYAPATAEGYSRGYNPRKLPYAENALGKLPGSVWEIPTEPLHVPEHLDDHFAAFPTEWPRQLILGWSPEVICSACGQGRRPVHAACRQRGNDPIQGAIYGRAGKVRTATGRQHIERTVRAPMVEVCACSEASAPESSASTRPGVVLDPFGGTGTTALAAKALGRIGVTVDRSAGYCRTATWRVSDRGQLAKAMRVPKPPAETDGQLAAPGRRLVTARQFPAARPTDDKPLKPAKRPSRIIPHGFERDEDVPADFNGHLYCRCGVVGEEGDERHPVGALPLSLLVFPPRPEDDRSNEIIGEHDHQEGSAA